MAFSNWVRGRSLLREVTDQFLGLAETATVIPPRYQKLPECPANFIGRGHVEHAKAAVLRRRPFL
jgi:hypothetical protein